jgi:hypothetical protein
MTYFAEAFAIQTIQWKTIHENNKQYLCVWVYFISEKSPSVSDTDSHNTTEILLKVALNIINHKNNEDLLSSILIQTK